MICPDCGATLSSKDVTCICKRKRKPDERFQKDNRYIVETKTEKLNVDEKTETQENEQTKISNVKSDKRSYGTRKSFDEKDKFSGRF
jgi:hypothetical protein